MDTITKSQEIWRVNYWKTCSQILRMRTIVSILHTQKQLCPSWPDSALQRTHPSSHFIIFRSQGNGGPLWLVGSPQIWQLLFSGGGLSLNIKGCVRPSVTWFHHYWFECPKPVHWHWIIKHSNASSQESDSDFDCDFKHSNASSQGCDSFKQLCWCRDSRKMNSRYKNKTISRCRGSQRVKFYLNERPVNVVGCLEVKCLNIKHFSHSYSLILNIFRIIYVMLIRWWSISKSIRKKTLRLFVMSDSFTSLMVFKYPNNQNNIALLVMLTE